MDILLEPLRELEENDLNHPLKLGLVDSKIIKSAIIFFDVVLDPNGFLFWG